MTTKHLTGNYTTPALATPTSVSLYPEYVLEDHVSVVYGELSQLQCYHAPSCSMKKKYINLLVSLKGGNIHLGEDAKLTILRKHNLFHVSSIWMVETKSKSIKPNG